MLNDLSHLNSTSFNNILFGNQELSDAIKTNHQHWSWLYFSVMKKAKIRNRYNQVPSRTQGTIWEIGKATKHRETSHTRGQAFSSRWPQCCKKQISCMTKTNKITKMIHNRRTALERSVRKLLEGLNMFHGTNLTLNSFVCLFDLILYVPSTIFQSNRDGSSWIGPVLS